MVIYGIEPHASDEWWLGETRTLRLLHDVFESEAAIDIPQAVTMAERNAAAAHAHKVLFDEEIPLYVDTIDNYVFSLYASRPTRFYLIDTDGIVIFEQEFLSYAFNPQILDDALADYVSGDQLLP